MISIIWRASDGPFRRAGPSIRATSDRSAEIAQGLARIARTKIHPGGQAGGGEIAPRRRQLAGHDVRADHLAAAVVADGGGEIERRHADGGGEFDDPPRTHGTAKQIDQIPLLGMNGESVFLIGMRIEFAAMPWATAGRPSSLGLKPIDDREDLRIRERAGGGGADGGHHHRSPLPLAAISAAARRSISAMRRASSGGR
jgi:hypothetical protein